MLELKEFIFRWQTLIWSALGPFFAIIISVLGFLIKWRIDRNNKRKDAINRAEISFTQAINNISTVTAQLKDFDERVQKTISTITTNTETNTIAINTTNFPATVKVYHDDELLKLQFGSYYLHNKILYIENQIKFANITIKGFKEGYRDILNNNIEFVHLIRNEKNHKDIYAKQQRDAYIGNLQMFTKCVNDLINFLQDNIVKKLFEAKVYNLKLMKRYNRNKRKYEWTSFKYFKNKKEIDEYKEVKSINRIDAAIKEDVDKEIKEYQSQ